MDVKLSKQLSYVLRHKALELGFKIDSGGYVSVAELLQNGMFKRYTEADIRRVVNSNDKQRYSLKDDPSTGQLMICANQGHSFELPDLDLEEITSAADHPTVVHGTYFKNWTAIQTEGLRRMNRTHIHFAAGEPGADGVISGMRRSCQLMIFIDLQSALQDHLKFFVSKNGVILCPGDKDGVLSPKYFRRVIRTNPRQEIPFQRESSRET